MELLFDLNCPACANQWQAPLEVDVYLWHEFDTHARELLENIHLLAPCLHGLTAGQSQKY